jgi:hypothetical protein
MKRLLISLLLLLWSLPAFAQLPLTGAGRGALGGGGGCSQATTFLARTSGLSGTETTAYTNMICGMVTDGTWTKFDLLYIFATNTGTTALLNLVSTSFTATNTGALTFTADQGFTGAGASGITTNWTPSTQAANFTLNGGGFGVYVRTSRTTGNNNVAGGTRNIAGTNFTYLKPRNSANAIEFGITDGSFSTISNTNAQGSWFINRTSSSNIDTYHNAGSTPFGSVTANVVGTLSDNAAYIFAYDDGSYAGPSTDQQAAFWVGGGFSATDVSNIQSRVNAFMTAVGANVY